MSASSPTVQRILDDLIKREGGYVDHPADRGGPTKYGITQQTARAYGYMGEMANLPLAVAKNIYLAQYWYNPGFASLIPVVGMERLAEELFDTGVNMGPKRAVRFLQRSLNVLNREGKDYADIAVDGDFGPATEAALKHLKAKRGAAAEDALLVAVDALQGNHYITLAERRPNQEAFVFGWLTKRLRNVA